ncbi:MAG: prolyl aminopeptidase [Plesiomonas sp.]|uniref:prolyl aminopeptidase n=1 Tax=Plesiomonas sp. TaxID=2486279 RepID=UPI003EE67AF3
MFHLYPPIHPFASGFIRRGEHQIYVEQAGNPQGIPVLFVHGGPGAGCSEQSRRFFDPARFHIILFDQRGCGRSLPYGSLQDNHPQALIDDMEAIRESLDVSQWMLFGGSWGSTLSLLYAIAHPQRVSAMVLRGIFLSRQQDFDWLYSPQGGASQVFPEHYQQFIAPLGGVTDSEQVLEGYWQRLSSDNELERSAAAKSWALWEAHLMQLLPDPTVWEQMSNLQHAVALARLECHYFRAVTRLPENFIVQNAAVLQAIPVRIVHGRYDMICPFENAWQLCQALPQAALQVVPNAGHSSMEPGITDGLIRALLELTEAYPL